MPRLAFNSALRRKAWLYTQSITVRKPCLINIKVEVVGKGDEGREGRDQRAQRAGFFFHYFYRTIYWMIKMISNKRRSTHIILIPTSLFLINGVCLNTEQIYYLTSDDFTFFFIFFTFFLTNSEKRYGYKIETISSTMQCFKIVTLYSFSPYYYSGCPL